MPNICSFESEEGLQRRYGLGAGSPASDGVDSPIMTASELSPRSSLRLWICKQHHQIMFYRFPEP